MRSGWLRRTGRPASPNGRQSRPASAALGAGAGHHARQRAPGNLRIQRDQALHQRHILAAGMRREAAGPKIGPRTDAKIGAVDMAMVVPALVPGGKPDGDVRRMLAPVVDGDQAAYGIGAQRQLRDQPVGRHAAVGIGKGQPARIHGQQQLGPGVPRDADIARRDGHAGDVRRRMAADDVQRTVAAVIEYHHQRHGLAAQVGVQRGGAQREQAGLQRGFFIVDGYDDADHRMASRLRSGSGLRDQTSSRKSGSRCRTCRCRPGWRAMAACT
jgi:hypothetical protein